MRPKYDPSRRTLILRALDYTRSLFFRSCILFREDRSVRNLLIQHGDTGTDPLGLLLLFILEVPIRPAIPVPAGGNAARLARWKSSEGYVVGLSAVSVFSSRLFLRLLPALPLPGSSGLACPVCLLPALPLPGFSCAPVLPVCFRIFCSRALPAGLLFPPASGSSASGLFRRGCPVCLLPAVPPLGLSGGANLLRLRPGLFRRPARPLPSLVRLFCPPMEKGGFRRLSQMIMLICPVLCPVRFLLILRRMVRVSVYCRCFPYASS